MNTAVFLPGECDLKMRKSIWVFIFLFGIILAILLPNFPGGKGENDFLRYWSATRIFITGGDPYDETSLRNLQRANHPNPDLRDKDLGYVWNSPLLLLILSPLAILPFALAFKLWIFLNVFLLVIILFKTWQMAGGLNFQKYFPLVLCSGFLLFFSELSWHHFFRIFRGEKEKTISYGTGQRPGSL